MDALVKLVSKTFTVFAVTFFRMAVSALALMSLLSQAPLFKTARPVSHFVRCLFGTAGMILIGVHATVGRDRPNIDLADLHCRAICPDALRAGFHYELVHRAVRLLLRPARAAADGYPYRADGRATARRRPGLDRKFMAAGAVALAAVPSLLMRPRDRPAS